MEGEILQLSHVTEDSDSYSLQTSVDQLGAEIKVLKLKIVN